CCYTPPAITKCMANDSLWRSRVRQRALGRVELLDGTLSRAGLRGRAAAMPYPNRGGSTQGGCPDPHRAGLSSRAIEQVVGGEHLQRIDASQRRRAWYVPAQCKIPPLRTVSSV